MLTNDYLALHLVRLKPPDGWSCHGNGLSFLFLRGGAGKCVCGPVSLPLRPGDLLVLDSSSRGEVSANEAGELVFWCFSVCVEHLFPLFASPELSVLQGVADGFKTAKLYAASSPLAMECSRLLEEVPPQFNLDHRGQLLRVVAAVLSVEFKTARAQRSGYVRVDEHMTQVFEKLSVNEILNLSVGELADRFSCSRRHLNRLFHQYFGLSVASLRMEMRLLKAVSLLRDPDAKVINVADQCGFNHLGLFNSCFKRRFGVSPGQWRKGNNGVSQGNVEIDGEPNCRLRGIGLCPWAGKPAIRPSMGRNALQLRPGADESKPDSGLVAGDGATASANAKLRPGPLFRP